MRGHGTPGLVDFLRTFAELQDDVHASRRPYLDFSPGVEVDPASFAPHSGNAYKAVVMHVYDEIVRDIVGVDTPLGPLVRVETAAEVVATAGTFFCNIRTAKRAPEYWGMPASQGVWDPASAMRWGTYTVAEYPPLELYVHLPAGADPRAQAAIVANLGFYFGVRGEWQPALGPDKLAGAGDFPSLTGWTETVAGAGWSSALDAALFFNSPNSLKLVSTGAATGDVSRHADVASEVEGWYRLSGRYQVNGVHGAFNAANLAVRLLVGNTAGTLTLYEDGRDADTNGAVALRPPYAEWRGFHFDFLAPATTTRIRLQLRAAASAGVGQVNFDRVRVQRIHRWTFIEPRLDAESLPEAEIASQSLSFGGKTVGLGDVSILDGDGLYAGILPNLLTENAPAAVHVGGALPDGQEVYRDDWRQQWPARAGKVTANDSRIRFETEDARGLVHLSLPPRDHGVAEDAAMDLKEEGKPRRLIFTPADSAISVSGTLTYPVRWKPRRVGKTANGYGIYEIGDVAGSLAGMYDSFPVVFAYANEDSAEKGVAELNAIFTRPGAGNFEYPDKPGAPYNGAPYLCTYDRATGLLTVIRDLRPLARRRDGSAIIHFGLEWDFGGATTGFNTIQTATAYLYPDEFARVFTTADPTNLLFTYSETTKKFTVAKITGGTFNFHTKTHANDDAIDETLKLMGFDTSIDHTGALSYTAENAIFSDVDTDHIIRVAANGLRDDAAGTMTGTANGPVYKHPDVARYLLQQYLKQPTAAINVAEFVAGRALDAGGVRMILEDREGSADTLEKLERGAVANLILDGEGVWRWRPYQAGQTPTREFFERDFLTFEMARDPVNLLRAVRHRFGRNPAVDSSKVIERVADAGIPVKYRRSQVEEFETFVDGELSTYATTLTDRLARLYAANPWWVSFTARGKLVDVLVGDIVRLNRSRAYFPGGSLVGADFRVFALGHDALSGISRCIAVEDVEFMT